MAIGVPAFATLGFADAHALPGRSKAFSMQVQDPWACLGTRSEEKRCLHGHGSKQGGSRDQSPSVRSLLLEPDDMDDLTSSLWRGASDLNDLSGPDEEEELSAGAEDTMESREPALFCESIFSSDTLPALPLTQAD